MQPPRRVDRRTPRYVARGASPRTLSVANRNFSRHRRCFLCPTAFLDLAFDSPSSAMPLRTSDSRNTATDRSDSGCHAFEHVRPGGRRELGDSSSIADNEQNQGRGEG